MIIPVVIGAIILGRSFDYPNGKVKDFYIYDQDDISKNIQSIEKVYTNSRYRLLESSSDANDLLDVSGDLSLKVKNGDMSLEGSGKYLSKSMYNDKTVEMLVTVVHETVTETFPSYTKLRTDWMGRPQSDVGTHYIRSITYGGQLMISYKLTATKSEYLEQIKAAVDGSLAMSGTLDAEVKGKLDKLSKEVGDKSRVDIEAFATAGLFDPPQNIEGCLKLVDDYPSLVKAIPGGKGAPLKMELVDLSNLNKKYTVYLRNRAMDGMLNEAIDKYDDLRLAWDDYKAWERNSSTIWTPEQEEMIDEYFSKLKTANNAMNDAITNLDASGGLDQFDAAFKAYGTGAENLPNRYSRDLKELIHTLDKIPFYWFPFTKALSNYVHWGSINCTLPSSEPLFIGYAGTGPKGFGNGGSIQCYPATKPAFGEKTLPKDVAVSHTNGLNYQLPDGNKGETLCASCKLENATAAYTIAGKSECPGDMKLEYGGFLMTSRDTGLGSIFVCMDGNPDPAIPGNPTMRDETAASLIPVWTVCKNCDEDDNKRYVSCVVCSR